MIESNMILRKWMTPNKLSSDRRGRGNKDQCPGKKKTSKCEAPSSAEAWL